MAYPMFPLVSAPASYMPVPVDLVQRLASFTLAHPGEPGGLTADEIRTEAARLLSKLSALPDVRSELVDRIRQEIASGTYETEDRLDQAVANLAEELDAQG